MKYDNPVKGVSEKQRKMTEICQLEEFNLAQLNVILNTKKYALSSIAKLDDVIYYLPKIKSGEVVDEKIQRK